MHEALLLKSGWLCDGKPKSNIDHQGRRHYPTLGLSTFNQSEQSARAFSTPETWVTPPGDFALEPSHEMSRVIEVEESK